MKAMMRKTLSAPGMLKLLDAAFRKIELPLRQASCRHSTSDCLKFVLAMFKMKWSSLLETERNLKKLGTEAGNLKRLFGLTRIPSDETVRRRLGMIAPGTLDRAFASVIAALQRGKALERMTRLDGHYLLAIDGTRTYQSKRKSCSRCLKTHHGDGSITYSHSELFAVLTSVEHQAVLPLVEPEPIQNGDGGSKQDCELNAFKRLLPRIRLRHAHMKLMVLLDSLYPSAPVVRLLRKLGMNFLITAKKGAAPHLHKHFNTFCRGRLGSVRDDGKLRREYRWARDLPLSESASDVRVNALMLREIDPRKKDRNGDAKVTTWLWITDLPLSKGNVKKVAEAARTRWKIENNTIKTLKDLEGCRLKHNHGHGESHLHHTLTATMTLAFLMDNVERLMCPMFQAALAETRTFRKLWETMRRLFASWAFADWHSLYDSIARPEILPMMWVSSKPPTGA